MYYCKHVIHSLHGNGHWLLKALQYLGIPIVSYWKLYASGCHCGSVCFSFFVVVFVLYLVQVRRRALETERQTRFQEMAERRRQRQMCIRDRYYILQGLPCTHKLGISNNIYDATSNTCTSLWYIIAYIACTSTKEWHKHGVSDLHSPVSVNRMNTHQVQTQHMWHLRLLWLWQIH